MASPALGSHLSSPCQLMHKLSVEAPPKILVERYLIEIAKNYNVPYEPDSVVMVSHEDGQDGLPQDWVCVFPSLMDWSFSSCDASPSLPSG